MCKIHGKEHKISLRKVKDLSKKIITTETTLKLKKYAKNMNQL